MDKILVGKILDYLLARYYFVYLSLSLFNLDQKNNYGVLEIGMDKKGEIDYLSKIVKPDVSVITNINYAHAKNFKNIKQIALAKSEIINNTKIKIFFEAIFLNLVIKHLTAAAPAFSIMNFFKKPIS